MATRRPRRRPKRRIKDSSELLVDTGSGIPLPDYGGLASSEDQASDLSSSTASFRAICSAAPHTLPEIRLDLSEEERAALDSAALAAWERLRSLLDDDGEPG